MWKADINSLCCFSEPAYWVHTCDTGQIEILLPTLACVIGQEPIVIWANQQRRQEWPDSLRTTVGQRLERLVQIPGLSLPEGGIAPVVGQQRFVVAAFDDPAVL